MGYKRKLNRTRKGPSIGSQLARETGINRIGSRVDTSDIPRGPKGDPATWGGNPRGRKKKRKKKGR